MILRHFLRNTAVVLCVLKMKVLHRFFNTIRLSMAVYSTHKEKPIKSNRFYYCVCRVVCII